MGPRRKWQFDLNSESIQRESLPDPPGFDHGSITTDEGSKTSTQLSRETEMKQKRAMEIAYGPGKNIFMQGFMMWMSGSQINIWSMMITGMALINPIKAIADTNRTFARLDDGKVDLMMPKLVFIVLNIVRRATLRAAGARRLAIIAPHLRVRALSLFSYRAGGRRRCALEVREDGPVAAHFRRLGLVPQHPHAHGALRHTH